MLNPFIISRDERRLSETKRILESIPIDSVQLLIVDKYDFKNGITIVVHGAADGNIETVKSELSTLICYIKAGRYDRELLFGSDLLASIARVFSDRSPFDIATKSLALRTMTCICATSPGAAIVAVENKIFEILTALVEKSSDFDEDILPFVCELLLNTTSHQEFLSCSILSSIMNRYCQSLESKPDACNRRLEAKTLELVTILMEFFDNIEPGIVYRYLHICKWSIDAKHVFLLPQICRFGSVLAGKGPDYEDAILNRGFLAIIVPFLNSLSHRDYWRDILDFVRVCLSFGSPEQQARIVERLDIRILPSIVAQSRGSVVAIALEVITRIIIFEPSLIARMPMDGMFIGVCKSLDELTYNEKKEIIRLLLHLLWFGNDFVINVVLDSTLVSHLFDVLGDGEDDAILFATDVLRKMGDDGRYIFTDEVREVIEQWNTSDNEDIRERATYLTRYYT